MTPQQLAGAYLGALGRADLAAAGEHPVPLGGVQMFFLGTQAGRRGRAVLAVCALAGLAAVAGCSGPSTSTQIASVESSWAGALGSGVTVDSPGSAPPGNDSPQGVMIGVATAHSTGHFSDCASVPVG